jgi:hypothetical protein
MKQSNENLETKRTALANACATTTEKVWEAKSIYLAFEYNEDINSDFVATKTGRDGNEYAVVNPKTLRPGITHKARDRMVRLTKGYMSINDIRRGWEFLAKDARWVELEYVLDLDKSLARLEKGQKWNDMSIGGTGGGDRSNTWQKENNRIIKMKDEQIAENKHLKAMYNRLHKVFK